MRLEEEQQRELEEKRKSLKKRLFESKYPKGHTYDAMSHDEMEKLDRMVESGLGLFQKRIQREENIAKTELVRGFFYGIMFCGIISMILKLF